MDGGDGDKGVAFLNLIYNVDHVHARRDSDGLLPARVSRVWRFGNE